MRRRLVLAGAALVVVAGGAWVAAGTSSGGSLNERERTVVAAMNEDGHPIDAARFVDDNVDVLFSGDVADAVDGGDLADLFEEALNDPEAGSDLLGRIAAAVADEGAIHSGALRPVFAQAVSANMAWADQRINGPTAFTAADLPDDVRADYLSFHDFLREVLRDGDAVERLRQALDDYGIAAITEAPDTGQDRALRLQAIGRVLEFFNTAQHNAESGRAVEEEDARAFDAADDARRSRAGEVAIDRAVWLAADLVARDPALREEAPTEARAFERWAQALRGTTAAPGPTWADNNMIQASERDIGAPNYGVYIEHRY